MQQDSARHLPGSREARLPDYRPGMPHIQPHGVSDTFRDLSHEVRTSLAIVTLLSGNLDLFYEQMQEDERRRLVQNLRKQMARLNELVADVLAFAANDG
jgi:signal transduction histidine kinase